MLRPHSALHYAWDEPSLPHELLLELPGRRRLGCFALDKVCYGHNSEPFSQDVPESQFELKRPHPGKTWC